MSQKNDSSEKEKDFEPSKWRMGVHVILGAIIGAPIGAMVVSAIAAIIGSFIGLFQGFGRSIRNRDFWGFLFISIDNIGNGAARQACDWTVYGAKYGPWVFAVIAFLMAMTKWEDEDDGDEDEKEGKE